MRHGTGHVGNKVELLRLGILLAALNTLRIIPNQQEVLGPLSHGAHQKVVVTRLRIIDM